MPSEKEILQAKILIVDDEPLSIRLLTDILTKAGYSNLVTTTDSRVASALYHKENPDAMILDLNMPYLDGFQVMEQLKSIEGSGYLPIIILSNEENKEARFRALESGAKDFVNKPYDRVEVLIRIRNLLEVRMLHNEVRGQNRMLEEKVKERTQELYETQLDVIQRLARAIEYRDLETGMHIVRMSHYCSLLASKCGLSMEESELILTASLLHDVGKIGIPDSILLKPGKLTPEEWAIMKTHTTIGAELLSGGKSKLMKLAQEIALCHHEHWDGSGYPKGLKGDAIPMVGRVCGLCDVYDALLTKRPYKRAWTVEETLEEIKKESGKYFDPFVVKSFFEIIPQITYIGQKYQDVVTDSNH